MWITTLLYTHSFLEGDVNITDIQIVWMCSIAGKRLSGADSRQLLWPRMFFLVTSPANIPLANKKQNMFMLVRDLKTI